MRSGKQLQSHRPMPGGSGTLEKSRGTENIAVSPVVGSMLTTMVVSVLSPRRPAPASAPRRTMFSRSRPSHSAGTVVVVVVGGTVVVVVDGRLDAGPTVDVVGAGTVVVDAGAPDSAVGAKTVVTRSYWV
jgi:hypothetical protein